MKTRVWDRFHQMPKGREFEIYHYAEDELQPVWYHAHPYYEIYFYMMNYFIIFISNFIIISNYFRIKVFIKSYFFF